MPPLSIPQPQPTDLQNPVPVEKTPDLDELAKQFSMPAQSAPGAMPQEAPSADVEELSKAFQMPAPAEAPANPEDTSGVLS